MLSKTAEYALRVTVWLTSAPAQPWSADAIAKGTKVPRRYLQKVLQGLVEAGLAASQSGPGGGYSLVRNPDTITILDVVNAVAPIERITECPLGLPLHTTLCPLHSALDHVYASTEQ